MAKIRSFTFRPASNAPQSEVDATWAVIGSGSDALVQIRTYGSDFRQSQPKPSQTIQFDEETAARLINVFVDTYGEGVLRRR